LKGKPERGVRQMVLMVPQNCHPHRSVAEWRDLLFFPGSHAAILLEGKPEGDVRQMAVNGPTELSSRPERSGVEGPAVSFPVLTRAPTVVLQMDEQGLTQFNFESS
jgi:hypothetical protein